MASPRPREDENRRSFLVSTQDMISPKITDRCIHPTQKIVSKSPVKDTPLSTIDHPSEEASTPEGTSQTHKDILAAARAGDLLSVQGHCTAGQMEITDSMGEVSPFLNWY